MFQKSNKIVTWWSDYDAIASKPVTPSHRCSTAKVKKVQSWCSQNCKTFILFNCLFCFFWWPVFCHNPGANPYSFRKRAGLWSEWDSWWFQGHLETNKHWRRQIFTFLFPVSPLHNSVIQNLSNHLADCLGGWDLIPLQNISNALFSIHGGNAKDCIVAVSIMYLLHWDYIIDQILPDSLFFQSELVWSHSLTETLPEETWLALPWVPLH